MCKVFNGSVGFVPVLVGTIVDSTDLITYSPIVDTGTLTWRVRSPRIVPRGDSSLFVVGWATG